MLEESEDLESAGEMPRSQRLRCDKGGTEESSKVDAMGYEASECAASSLG